MVEYHGTVPFSVDSVSNVPVVSVVSTVPVVPVVSAVPVVPVVEQLTKAKKIETRPNMNLIASMATSQ